MWELALDVSVSKYHRGSKVPIKLDEQRQTTQKWDQRNWVWKFAWRHGMVLGLSFSHVFILVFPMYLGRGTLPGEMVRCKLGARPAAGGWFSLVPPLILGQIAWDGCKMHQIAPVSPAQLGGNWGNPWKAYRFRMTNGATGAKWLLNVLRWQRFQAQNSGEPPAELFQVQGVPPILTISQ